MNEPTDLNRDENALSQGADQVPDAQVPVAEVWPPPPTGGPGVPASVLLPHVFVSIQRLGGSIIALLAVHGILSALSLSTSLMSPTASRLTISAVAIVQFLLLLATGLCFLVWTYRMDQNLRAFRVTGLRFQPGWAVGYFFVPIMNLYRPYQVLREIWQASDPSSAVENGASWKSIRPPLILGFWWVSWLLANMIDGLAAQDTTAPDVNTVGAAFRLVSAVLALLVVRLFTARQEKTARQLSQIP